MNRIGNSSGIIYPPLFAVLIAVCSWLSIPSAVPFTMQTFGVCLTLLLLGGKGGTAAVLVYLFMGTIGLPVFHGFTGGLGVLMSPSGGFLLGFAAMAGAYWIITHVSKNKPFSKAVGIAAGMTVCYFAGTLWFAVLYTEGTGTVNVGAVLGVCVLPFIVPDMIKILLAFYLTKRIHRHTKNLYL